MYVAYRYARELTPSKIPAGSVCRLFPSRYLVGASGGGAGRPKMGCTRISWRFGLGSASCSLQLVSIGFRVKEDTYTRMYIHHTHIYIYARFEHRTLFWSCHEGVAAVRCASWCRMLQGACRPFVCAATYIFSASAMNDRENCNVTETHTIHNTHPTVCYGWTSYVCNNNTTPNARKAI